MDEHSVEIEPFIIFDGETFEVTRAGVRLASMLGLPHPDTLVDIADALAEAGSLNDRDTDDVLMDVARAFATGHLSYDRDTHALIVAYDDGETRHKMLRRPFPGEVRVALAA